MKIRFSKKILIEIFIIIVILGAIYLYHGLKILDINKYTQTTKGIVIECYKCFGSSSCIKYKYKVDGIYYVSEASPALWEACRNCSCLNKQYTVEYSAKKPTKSRIIIDGKTYY